MITINGKYYDTTEVIKIEIGDNSYSLPLIKYLPYKFVKKLSKIQEDKDLDPMFEVLSNYIPENVLDELSVSDIAQIMQAWNNAGDTDIKN